MSDADSQNSELLRFQNVHKSFRQDAFKPKQHVLRGLTCSFNRGECTGFLGHNGAGKTTAIRTIFGLVVPDAGEVLYAGKPITTSTKNAMGYMPEMNRLPPALTCIEALQFHLDLLGRGGNQSRTVIEGSLEKVGLQNHKSKKIKHLSKGMARRLAYAQATIHEPEFLVLDEPFSGLDPLGRAHMLEWIESERSKGTTILLCTHELKQISTLCDQFHILNQGRVKLSTTEASAAELRQGASHVPSQTYQVSVSGVDEDFLRTMFKQNGLPPWQTLSVSGFLVRLGFSDYTHSTAWLSTLLAQNIVVTGFGDFTTFGEEDLMPFFEVEEAVT